MLKLDGITKVYSTADTEVHALRGVSIAFRRCEFVAVLGASGCGKTTMLNIVGGLDQYTSGDLFIDGRSTRQYTDRDWDTYRNHSVGFVFQSYNLIPHQTILSNVELALTLSGVSREERRRRAEEVLQRVGLGEQLHKKPNQLSGGQMQRVAIARALVNDPEILLADEPTGALDSKTSVQIMEILKEIAQDRLIIMVTHNPELAEKYATRIVRLHDGEIVGDTLPYSPEEEAEECRARAAAVAEAAARGEDTAAAGGRVALRRRKKKSSMSFFTALALSFNNLMTKKGRTFLTSFAGSIGIIGIALILAVSSGVQNYINAVQQDTLTSYPITIRAEEADMSSLLTTLMGGSNEEDGEHPLDAVYSNVVMYQLMSSFLGGENKQNNLRAFKEFIDQSEVFAARTTALQYLYKTGFTVYTRDTAGNTVAVDAAEVFSSVLGDVSDSSMMTSYTSMVSSSAAMEMWEELIPGKADADGNRDAVSPMLREQYKLLSGTWPTRMDEVVLIVNERNEIPDMACYALGLKDRAELSDIMAAIMAQEKYEAVSEHWSYEELLDLGLSLTLPVDFYVKTPTADGTLFVKSDDPDYAVNTRNLTLHVTGIIAPADDATATALSGTIGYTYLLTDYMIEETAKSEIVQAQLLPENANRDVVTGLPFTLAEREITDAERAAEFLAYVGAMDDSARSELLFAIRGTIPADLLEQQVAAQMMRFRSDETDPTSPYDRTKMEEHIKMLLSASGAGEGASLELVEKYIARLSDDRLAELITESIRTMIREAYRSSAESALNAQLDRVTDADLAECLRRLGLTDADRAAKQAYLLEAYAAETGCNEEVRAAHDAYLTARSDAEIDALLDGLLRSTVCVKLVSEEAYRAGKAAGMLGAMLAAQDEGSLASLHRVHMPSETAGTTKQDNLAAFGYVDEASPDQIVIYAATFEDKEMIEDAIAAYNRSATEEDRISYTDYVALLMSSVTTIINAISYVLIAFVAISLVVSSIMIGIITYISVLERTKEIGILRAIGASKRDISSVFNAETLTVGLVAGLIGIGVTLLLVLAINIVLHALTGIANLSASLPVGGALILIAISMLLTFIAGLIPARLAAKKDPVVALRSE